MVIDGELAHLRTPADHPALWSVLAIPGRGYHPDDGHWSVKLRNDRPRSLLRLADRYSIAISPADRLVLESAAADRPTFDLELVRPSRRTDFPNCISVCDDWDDPELRLLSKRLRRHAHPDVGRLSIVVDRRSAAAFQDLHTRRPDVRWTGQLAAEIEQALDARRATPTAVNRGRRTASVRFVAGRDKLEIASYDRDAVIPGFAAPTRVGKFTFHVPADRAAALSVARLTQRHPDVLLSPSVADWMPTATRWTGRLTATTVDGVPAFVVLGDHHDPPACLTSPPATPTEPGAWRLPLDAAGHAVLVELLAAHPQTKVDPYALRCIQALTDHPDAPVPPAIVTVDDHDATNEDATFTLTRMWANTTGDEIAAMPGARPRSAWIDRTAGIEVLADAWNATSVHDHATTHGLELDDAARTLLDRLLADHQHAAGLVTLSGATHGTLDLPTLAGDLMPFQAAGVTYARAQRRTFIADEQGLGKTVQALATVEADDAFPAIVICPASLKLNWQREAGHWLPHRTIGVITGRSPAPLDTEILVLNYEILDAHRDALTDLEAGALVLDESHYCKNPRARRTQEAHLLSSALRPDALRLALTGTPLVNRAKELVPQLRLLGRLDEFGSAAEFERKFSDPANRDRLHWHLRRSCYVRRLKRDVLPQLPAKQRAVVPVALDNAADYARAEAAFLTWLQDHYRDSADLARRLDSAMRAEALVKINALRKLTGTGKISVATEWIEDFVASREKLIVFAEHRDVQTGLVARFPQAAHLLGADSQAERQHAVDRFQHDPDVLLCICSLKVAAHGITLTAAANVAFVELGWTPAEHDQAEDRCHRIGQDNAVTAWYLLAAGTIDDRLSALIDHKRVVVGAITDGAPPTEGPMVDALLTSYIGESAPSV
ncbi:MAG TPA: DEAD/DEAH box helicase [Solirubrobacteraceae bacterium]|nr:DEAD/DEAH box helicase [Solirubrobacteraceae bacterium]